MGVGPPRGGDLFAVGARRAPGSARRYLLHAIAPGAPLGGAVRLRMHGEIKLRRWRPFTAEQVIVRERGMIWNAVVRLRGLPIRGSDRFLDGEGAMRWRLLGLVPVMTATGPDVTRSAAGRFAGELVWLPSGLCRQDVSWTATDPRHPRARVTVGGHVTELGLALDARGGLRSVRFRRWGDPGGGFHDAPFGGLVEAEATFGAHTIPSRLRLGWDFDGERFDRDGEFFRVTLDEATYR